MQGTVTKKHGGFYEVSSNESVYKCYLSGKRKHFGKHPIVAGDKVLFDPPNQDGEEGYILDLLPRANYMPRPGVANVDQLLLIAAIHQPDHSLYQIDKLMAIARYYHIPTHLCISKMDLAKPGDEAYILDYYRNVPLKIFFVEKDDSLEKLGFFLRGKATVFTGNSGVGKSSLINKLLGYNVQDVNEISLKLNRGKHTTRTAEFFGYNDGFIIDTPGFSALSFPKEFKKEMLKDLYPEYAAQAQQCKFNNCVHLHEPLCKIMSLVEDGFFSRERYENYQRLYQEIEMMNA